MYNEEGRDEGYYLFYRPGHYDIVYGASEKDLPKTSYQLFQRENKQKVKESKRNSYEHDQRSSI